MKKYFYGKVDGLNADIKRHRDEEKILRDKIRQYEDDNNPMFVNVYKHALDQLLQSKAEVLSKLGRK